MKNKLVIIGSGNIGKRHLQAAAKVTALSRICCFDINPEAVRSVPEFCAANGLDAGRIEATADRRKMLAEVDSGTIVIIATTAQGRVPVFEEVLAKKPLAVLAEKPLCQNQREYERINELAAAAGVPVYVNFPRHAFPAYRKIHALMDRSQRIDFTAFFPDGMACIGIHMFELMTWLLNGRTFEIKNACSRGAYETKRAGYRDFDGEILLEINGKDLAFFSTVKETDVFSIKVSCGQKEFIVYEALNKLVSVDWGEVQLEAAPVLYVSQITDRVIAELLQSGRTEIMPDLAAAAVAHRILFDFLALSSLNGMNIT